MCLQLLQDSKNSNQKYNISDIELARLSIQPPTTTRKLVG